MKRLKMKKRFNENIHRPDVEDLDVPVTEEEEVLAQYIEERIAEEFGIGCSCETHNPGEEMHLEIFIGEDEYDEDTDLNELCANLEELVNQIGKQEKQDSGTEWGDARFSPQGDYIYGEVWPLEGEYAINPKGELAEESAGVEVPDDAVKVVADRAIELLESLGKSKNVIMYLIDPERTAVGGENTSELRNMVENRLWDWIEGDMPRNGNADYTLTELYEMIKSGEL